MLPVPLLKVFQRKRFRRLLGTMVLSSLFLSLIIVPIEKGSPSRIETYFDGLWWGVSTMTTVGYGDYVPVTVPGRMIGMLLQVIGAVLFSLTIAMMGAVFERSQAEFQWKRNWERLDKIEGMLDRIEKQSGYLVKKEDDLPSNS